MDGENLPDAIVSFMPNDKTLDPAVGTTDADGVYVLTQSVDREGLLAGTYAVRITTYRDAITDAEPMIPGVRERVPKKYNVETTLTVDVPNESGGYDFELDSDGPIFRIESL